MQKNILVDDMDGRWEDKVVEPHTISIDDRVYDIDLHDESFAELETAIAKFVENARLRTTRAAAHLRSVPSGSSKPTRNDPEQLKAIREWAWGHPQLVEKALGGKPLAKHGRIPKEVLDLYHELAGQTPIKAAEKDASAPAFSAAK